MRTVLMLPLLLLCLLQGCALTHRRNGSFKCIDQPPGAMLLLVGGNSEYSGDKGLWQMRERVAADVADALGLQRHQLSTDYVSWTGDGGDSPGIFPQNPQWLRGHLLISERLATHQQTGRFSQLVVVGWSNGGATATQLSTYLSQQVDARRIDLLVTLDPVSTLTRRPEAAGAGSWLNIYTRSTLFDRLTETSNWIAAFGGAWNQFSEQDGVPALQECMVGNHHDTERMWVTGVLPSPQFAAWAAAARVTLKTEGERPRKRPHSPPVFQRCP